MEEQEFYDELELVNSELKNGEIDVESATNKLDKILNKIEELIENKLYDLDKGYDQNDLDYEDD